MGTIDISKKSNIRCDHCDNWVRLGIDEGGCKVKHFERKAYYQRCKRFAWRKNGSYVDSSSGKTVVVVNPHFAGSIRRRRPVNISSINNVKCEHCDYWKGWDNCFCSKKQEKRLYYQRCKEFKWRRDGFYVSTAGGVLRPVPDPNNLEGNYTVPQKEE